MARCLVDLTGLGTGDRGAATPPVELPVKERTGVILAYLARAGRGGTKAADSEARFYFGLDPDPTHEDVEAIAEYYPVFRVEPAQG